MLNPINKVAHISMEGADEFFATLSRYIYISEYESDGMKVEIQYDTCMQPNGKALFSAVILGRI